MATSLTVISRGTQQNVVEDLGVTEANRKVPAPGYFGDVSLGCFNAKHLFAGAVSAKWGDFGTFAGILPGVTMTCAPGAS